MRYLLILLLTTIIYNAFAQKGIEKLSKYKSDSLQSIHVDPIIHYYAYCGECEILARPQCYMLSGYTLTENILIYKQQGKYYTLDFDCYNQPAKRLLDSCKSISYFITIISALDARDRIAKGRFFGPGQADGGFENADVYLRGKKQHIYMPETEETDFYKTYKKYFWVNKEIKLLKLIAADITAKDKEK